MYKKTMREALEQTRAYRDPVNEDRGFSSQQIKQAYGVLNDPRYKQGNYSGAYKAIEKIAKGLASHPDVANALKRANEELEEAKTAGGALAQGHLETMTDQRFKEFYGMTKDEYIKKHGDPRKEDLEESELNEALNINIVKGMTQRNDHFGARLYIAEQMKDKEMITIYHGLGLAHDNYNRYVGNSALMVRQKLESALKDKINRKWNKEIAKEIIKAL